MAYSKSQQKLARQIFDRFGYRIAAACKGSNVPTRLLAGIIANEAGKDKNGQIKESAPRFEKHVFANLKLLRDGKKRQYSGIKRSQIRDASDDALRALATSYQLTQIMGWHCINSLKCTVADIKSPEKHLILAVQLLEINSLADIKAGRFDRVCRTWNTGRPTGKTYHASYVPTAYAIMEAYADIERNNKPIRPTSEKENKPEITTNQRESAETSAATATVTETTEIQSETQNATVTETKNEQSVTETEQIAEPQPSGFFAKLTAGVTGLLGLTFVQDAAGKLSGIEISITTIYLVCFVLLLGFIGFVIWYVVDSWKQAKRVELQATINTDPSRKNFTWVDSKK